MTDRPNAAEIAEALADRIEDLAVYLIGDKPTSRTRSALRFYPRGGLAVETVGAKRGIWHDHAAGVGGDALDLVRHLRQCSMAEAIAWSRAWLGNAPVEPPERRPAPRPEPVEHDTRPLALRLWQEAKAPHGTPAEVYLRSRGLTLPDSDAIRFHPACPRGRNERLPAMVALMSDPVTAEPCGLHRTFLRPDGGGKIEHGAAKQMLGRAGIVRLVSDDEVALGLGLAEGIETALSIMQRAGWRPVWACGSAGAIAKFPVLAGIECLTVFADLDDKGAGLMAARACADRWREAGREARLELPPPGQDWFDALTRREAA